MNPQFQTLGSGIRLISDSLILRRAKNYLFRRYASRIVVSFDRDSAPVDGLGAQIQRQISCFLVSRYLGCRFQGRLITDVMVRESDFRQGKSKNELIEFANSILRLSTNEVEAYAEITHEIVSNSKTIRTDGDVIQRISNKYPRAFLVSLYMVSALTRMRIQLQIKDGFFLTNRLPDLYELIYVEPVSSYLRQHLDTGNETLEYLNIVVHIRRGEVSQYEKSEELIQRYSSTENFLNIITLVKLLPELQTRKTKIKIVTDSPTQDIILGNSFGQSNLWDKQLGLTCDQVIKAEDFSAITSIFPDVEILQEKDSISSLALMANADYLIMSKSSFSFIAAIYNQSGNVVYQNFWHKPLSRWIRVIPDSH